MRTDAQIAIIIVAYGHADTLPATLAALQQLDRSDVVTIVVENGDGSSAEVARSFAGVTALEPGRNLGFAGGCNFGVQHTAAPYIVLLNPDVEPQPSFVSAITAPLRDPQVGVVGAKLLYPDGRIQHAGGYLQEPTMLAQHHGYGEVDRGQHDLPRDVPFVTGAALAVRRETWTQLGGLDETFWPAYYEDVDLCWRVREHDLVVRYEPQAIAVHDEAAALGKTSEAYHRFYHRNRLRFIFKHTRDQDLVQRWLPTELLHLRTTAADAEIDALMLAYIYWQHTFIYGSEPNDQPALPTPITTGALDWATQQVAAKRTITPQPLRSRWALVARLRTWINRLATEDYLRPLIQQQNDYNAALHEVIDALARQRRTADAAIMCQGMLLAKLRALQHS